MDHELKSYKLVNNFKFQVRILRNICFIFFSIYVVCLVCLSMTFIGFVFFISSFVIFYRDDYMHADLNISRFILMVFIFIFQ
jgi:NADH:ubiquinone oxidoreductase subunit 5 (subunit L)/multisubunit Na+/H+ antiporter MnhA subunit